MYSLGQSEAVPQTWCRCPIPRLAIFSAYRGLVYPRDNLDLLKGIVISLLSGWIDSANLPVEVDNKFRRRNLIQKIGLPARTVRPSRKYSREHSRQVRTFLRHKIRLVIMKTGEHVYRYSHQNPEKMVPWWICPSQIAAVWTIRENQNPVCPPFRQMQQDAC